MSDSYLQALRPTFSGGAAEQCVGDNRLNAPTSSSRASTPDARRSSSDADLVARLSAALIAAREESVQLRAAQESNRDIGVAMGILMSRHAITREQAFDALRSVSQRSNLKLRDVARDVIDTAELALRACSSPPAGRKAFS